MIIVYFGDLITSNLVKEVCQGLSTRVVNMAGLTSLRELACLISLCNVLLTNDSGPMHIAGALNTPIVGFIWVYELYCYRALAREYCNSKSMSNVRPATGGHVPSIFAA